MEIGRHVGPKVLPNKQPEFGIKEVHFTVNLVS